jgi:RNA-binding protein YhbY
MKSLNEKDLLEKLKEIDQSLAKQDKSIEIITIGGVAILLQKIKERVTYDIDIAGTHDAELFMEECKKVALPAQIVSIASTVDFSDAETTCVFSGQALKVNALNPKDLIKLKLERFTKQDPEDIYAIIEKNKVDFITFKKIVEEALLYYVGRPQTYALHATIVVEQIYPDKIDIFKDALKL